MSGFVNPEDTVSINPGTANMTSPVADPRRPILENSSSGNYSSLDNKANISKERKNTDPFKPTVGIRGSGSTYTYEELSNGLTCPTCKGTGKIPRGQEDDLVALIPYGDKRLKPRRTSLYVFLSFFLCIALAGILCAFLIPRSIDVVHDNVTTIYVDLNVTEDRCFLSLLSIYNITNNNFVSVKTNDIQIQVTVLFNKLIIANTKFFKNDPVPIRAKEQIKKPLNMTLTNMYFPIMYCTPELTRDNFIYMMFQSTFNFTLMTQTDQQIVTAYFRVDCNPDRALDEDRFMLMQTIDQEEYLEALD